jgi:hypothetical protein
MGTKMVAANWRAFPAREAKKIEARLATPEGSICPRCGSILEACPPRSPDVLECRDCRRFHARSQAPETLYVLRMQRLATAILSI